MISIEQAIKNDNERVKDTMEKMKHLYNTEYLCNNPGFIELFRKDYDIIREGIEGKINGIKNKKDYYDKCIKNLEESKETLVELDDLLNKMSIKLNKFRVGTLHGLCKQVIKENRIPMEEVEQTVYDFLYDEKHEIEKEVGGKRNTKRKISKKRNNKSNKRNFKR